MTTFSVNNQGVITVDTSLIKEEFVEAYKGALGASLNTEAGTFQGQMIINDTQTLTTAMNEVVNVANNFSPYTATGEALDVIAAVYGYYRKRGVATTVYVSVTGTNGTVIPAGALVSDGTYEYAAQDAITISGGVGGGWFQCTTKGAIICPIGAIDSIISTITAWSTATNNTAGVTGYDTESDNEFRQRITANWFNLRAKSTLGAINDNIAAIDNVISVCARENPEDTSTTIDGQTLVAHSIYLCILGGAEEDIAAVLASQKTLGGAMNGNTTITYNDESTGATQTYTIKRPTVVNLAVQIEYEANVYTTATVETQMTALLMDYLSENPLKIGQTISGNALSQAFADFNQVNLLSVKVKQVGGVSFNNYLTTTIAQVATLSEANISYSEVV